jgi:CBS domain-containing protein
MQVAKKSLNTLTAADLMSREVVTVPEGLSMREAARRLAKNRVSGAPVVDGEGRCVGVLSAEDFVRPVVAGDLAGLPGDPVADHMTADPVMAPPTRGAREVARMLLDADVHRVIVVDGQRRPLGVVSRTDLVAALVYADCEK